MSKHGEDLVEQFVRFEALLRRYYLMQFIKYGPFNPYRGQGRVLSILKMKPEISQKELLYLLDISKQSLTDLLNKLERNGYIIRTQSEKDRRAFNIKLTPEGAAASENIEDTQFDFEKLFDCLNDEEKEMFGRYIERLIAELEKQLGDRGVDNTAFDEHIADHFFGGRTGDWGGHVDPRQRFGHGGLAEWIRRMDWLHGGHQTPSYPPTKPNKSHDEDEDDDK